MITGGNLAEANNPVSECALHVHGEIGICSYNSDINMLQKYIKTLNLAYVPPDIIEFLKRHLDVNRESEIYKHYKIRNFMGDTSNIIKTRFKPVGPYNNTGLLDNYNIDDTLSQWAKNSKKLYNKKFYHIPFQMIDFAQVKSQLATFTLTELITNKYDCFAVVLNTDISSGGGKHWFCLYGDFSHEGTTVNPHTLEYFNSSGNPPRLEVSTWMENAVYNLFRDAKYRCVLINSMDGYRIQYSNTECGMWSLMYIKSRLDNKPSDYFITASATDEDMIKLRAQLFIPK